MDNSKDKKIAEDIEQLITQLNKKANQQFRQDIHNYARKIFGSLMGRRPIEQPSVLKQKILNKVANYTDSSGVLQCQQTIQRFLETNSIIFQRKAQILKVLLKISQDTEKSYGQFDLFKSNKKQINSFNQTKYTLNQTQPSFHTSMPHSFPLISKALQDIRNRGSIKDNITESDLLKEVTYALQNIQGNYIYFQNNAYKLSPKIQTNETVHRIVNQLCEIGWLYSRITQSFKQQGVVIKALNLAISEELNEYYRWLAIIENMIKNQELTLRKLILWSYEPFQKLKWLAIILQAVRPFDGSTIISIVNSYRPQGSTPINQLLNRLLSHLLQPFFQYIHNWVYKGQLIDQHKQFFIEQRLNSTQDEWNSKYNINKNKIPNILDEQTANMIFNTGKTIYFLKNKCKCNYRVQIPFFDIKIIFNSKAQSNILTQLKIWVKSIYQSTNKFLVQTLFDKFHLDMYLDAIKKFFLLGQGNFIQYLIDSLRQQLCKPKHQIYENNLDGHISDALKYCFPQIKKNKSYFRQNVMDRLLSKTIKQYGSDGWNVFNFQFVVDDPIRTILSQQMMLNYQKIFHFLWKVKRYEQMVKQIWLNHTKDVNKHVKGIFHMSHILRNSMMHFVTNLYGYLMIAIQSVWDQFINNIKESSNFDEMLSKHRQVVIKIYEITLNTSKSKSINNILNNILFTINEFKALQYTLQQQFSEYSEKKREYEQQQEIKMRGLQYEKKMQLPVFGQTKTLNKFVEINNAYNDGLKRFFNEIKLSNDGLHVLGFRLDFSEYFSREYFGLMQNNDR